MTTHLLCRWHHKENIKTNCRKDFSLTDDDEEWSTFLICWLICLNALTKTEYLSLWAKMKRQYRASHSEPITYLDKNWQGASLPKLARFGTDQIFHLWNTTTSRAEGAHHVLKQALQVLTGNLKFVI